MKVIINRCLLFVLSFVLSSTALFSVFSANVSAASVYDDVYSNDGDLVIELDNYYNMNCEPIDIYLVWSALILEDPNNTAIADSFQTAIDSGSWGAYQISEGFGETRVRILWTETPATITFNSNIQGYPAAFFGANQTVHSVYISNKALTTGYQHDGCSPTVSQYESGNYSYGRLIDAAPMYLANKSIFYSNTSVVYPPDYEGELVRDSLTPPKIQILPDVNFRVSDKRLTAEYLKNVPGATDIQWGIASTDENWENLDLIDTFEYQIDKKVNFEYKFSERGKYLLYIKVYNRPPMLPTIPDEYQQPIEIYLPLDVNGTTFGGSTDDLDCGENNFCQPYTPYEDCTIYGGSAPYGFGGGEFPDIIGGIGCVWKNFGIFLVESLKNLFIPSDDFFPVYLDRFGDWLESKLGFVKTGFDMIIDWVTSLVVVSPTCVLDNPIEGTFFGASLDSVSICVFEEEAPTIFNLMRNIFRSLFAATLVFISWSRMQGIFREWAR